MSDKLSCYVTSCWTQIRFGLRRKNEVNILGLIFFCVRWLVHLKVSVPDSWRQTVPCFFSQTALMRERHFFLFFFLNSCATNVTGTKTSVGQMMSLLISQRPMCRQRGHVAIFLSQLIHPFTVTARSLIKQTQIYKEMNRAQI